MKECPRIDECKDKVSRPLFNAFCRVFFLRKTNYIDCPTYRLVTYGDQHLQTPREWKQKKEG